MTQPPRMAPPSTARSGFTDTAYPVLRQMQADLVAALHQVIMARGWTESQAAAALHVGRLRIAAIQAERGDRFTLDLLLGLAVRAGLAPRIVLADPRAVVPIRGQARAS